MKPSSSYSVLKDADDAALDSPVHHRVGRVNVDTTHHDTNNDKGFAIYTVPTKMPSDQQEEKKVIDTRYLIGEDLMKLKKQDPFLYYSLPKSVRRRDQFIGYEDVAVDTTESAPTTAPKSFAMVDSSHSSSTSTKVERRSCISFECHIDLILEEFSGKQTPTSAEVNHRQDADNRDAGADRDTYLQQ
jgi:hypothetical protein